MKPESQPEAVAVAFAELDVVGRVMLEPQTQVAEELQIVEPFRHGAALGGVGPHLGHDLCDLFVTCGLQGVVSQLALQLRDLPVLGLQASGQLFDQGAYVPIGFVGDALRDNSERQQHYGQNQTMLHHNCLSLYAVNSIRLTSAGDL